MDSITTTTTTATGWESHADEWELCNNEGFVYKRKKRRLDPAAAAAPDLAADPEAEEKKLKERKKKTLLKLKTQYQREIERWEFLSNALRAMEERSKKFEHEREREREDRDGSGSGVTETSEDAYGSFVDKLLFQAEAQEDIIHDVWNFCEVAEAMCNWQDDRLKQSLIDLPIWASPCELMESLCEDD